MTLLKDYLNQWATFEDERLYLLKKLDSSIMKAMLKNNIPLDEVKPTTRDYNDYKQKYMPRIFDFYVQKETKIMQILQKKVIN